ncbi:MAG: hypothetical protein K8T25_00935, partial [Planctomycetia bacterium]|nr:hypothetical protein [Planctomycetia bacterium]
FFGQDRLLLSRDAKQLAAALDVLDGKAGALAADSPLAEAAAAGTFMIARGIDMDAEKTPFHLEAVRKSKRLAVAAGQNEAELFVDAKLAAPDAKAAAQVAQAVDGFKAILQLQLSEDKNADAVLHGLKAEVADANVTIHWRAAGEDVAKLVAEEHQRMVKRHAEQKPEKKKPVPSGDD